MNDKITDFKEERLSGMNHTPTLKRKLIVREVRNLANIIEIVKMVAE